MTSAPAPRFLRYRLEPEELESEYRAGALPHDARVVIGLVIFALSFQVVSLPGILALLVDGGSVRFAWAIRAGSAAVAVGALLVLSRAPRVNAYDATVFAWALTLFLAGAAENLLLPADYTGFVAWDVFLVVSAYALITLPLARQTLLALTLTVCDLVVLWRFKVPQPAAMFDITMAFLCANVVGVFVSLEMHRWRRRAFIALRSEVDARAALEQALGEIKTLQGIIPICSFCKNIRTGVDDWQRVESYVQAHSDAEFSHGLCPSCAQKHYPDFYEAL